MNLISGKTIVYLITFFLLCAPAGWADTYPEEAVKALTGTWQPDYLKLDSNEKKRHIKINFDFNTELINIYERNTLSGTENIESIFIKDDKIIVNTYAFLEIVFRVDEAGRLSYIDYTGKTVPFIRIPVFGAEADRLNGFWRPESVEEAKNLLVEFDLGMAAYRQYDGDYLEEEPDIISIEPDDSDFIVRLGYPERTPKEYKLRFLGADKLLFEENKIFGKSKVFIRDLNAQPKEH